jgi:predicted membrane protein
VKELLKDIFNFIKGLFTKHPNSVGESYLKHMAWAIFFSIAFLFAGVICLIHAIFPFLFVETASSVAEWIVDTSKRRKGYYDHDKYRDDFHT